MEFPYNKIDNTVGFGTKALSIAEQLSSKLRHLEALHEHWAAITKDQCQPKIYYSYLSTIGLPVHTIVDFNTFLIHSKLITFFVLNLKLWTTILSGGSRNQGGVVLFF